MTPTGIKWEPTPLPCTSVPRRPDPRYGSIVQAENGVTSFYNGLALQARKQIRLTGSKRTCPTPGLTKSTTAKAMAREHRTST